MPEREPRRQPRASEQPNRSLSTPDREKQPRRSQRGRKELSREGQLEQAVRMLVDALDRCAGDEPDCPHCGPARSLAAELLTPVASAPSELGPKPERRTVAGRVGAELSFRTTANGLVIARFPLAIHGDNDKTTWETVIAFGKRAERLRGAVQKGQQVEVVGYSHERQAQTRDGGLKTIREFYAAAIKAR